MSMDDLQATPSSVTVFGRAFLLGVVAGSRSMLPLALESRAGRHDRFGVRAPFPLLARPALGIGLPLASMGEIIADKLPFVPSRVKPGPLASRAVLGSIAGAAFSGEAGSSPLAGAVAGAGGAVLGSVAAYQARAWVGRATGWPDPVWAVVEDILAIAMGRALIRTVERS